ncbi:hypothetical protein [Micromonospora okii]|uniref:hypothetical protein n=1 Tax=Micromonospora okii TaxID=1182970 RepID=UPI001E595EC2|nr:hypothetical protein [Micromonospora okii]
MEFLNYAVLQAAMQMPTLLVLVTGLVLAAVARDRLPRRSRTLLLAGAVVLLLGTLLSLAWMISLPQVYSSVHGSAQSIGYLSSAIGLVLTLLHATGLGLVIAAALTGRRHSATPPA